MQHHFQQTLSVTYIRRATRETVMNLSALENAQKISPLATRLWIEVGPHPVCTGYIKSTIHFTELAMPLIRRGDDKWITMTESMVALHFAGVEVGRNEFYRPFES